MITEDLQPLLVPIDSLSPLERNPRRGNVNAIKASLTQFGQLKPLVVNQDGEIIAGNHTHAAAVQLGWTEIAAVKVEATHAEALAFALADNHTSDLSRWDNKELLAMLAEVRTADATLLAATSFSTDDIDALLESTDQPAGFQPPEEDNSKPGEGVCPSCQRPL
jgi:ParB-like chromosome segregation protein Spo0J